MIVSHKNLNDLLPILSALIDGKEIEYKIVREENSCWKKMMVDTMCEYDFDLNLYEFRIKPERKLVPFTFEDAEFLIGNVIVSKDKTLYDTISRVSMSEEASGSKVNRGYQNLFESFNFLDGSPCGKYINE